MDKTTTGLVTLGVALLVSALAIALGGLMGPLGLVDMLIMQMFR